MADFDYNVGGGYFDFGNTDSFLDSLNTALPGFPPSPNSSDGYPDSNGLIKQENDGYDDIFKQLMSDDNQYQANLQSSSMSVASYSNDSSSNGVTPISQPSLSSAHTSPDTHLNTKMNHESVNSTNSDEDESSKPIKKPTKSKITKPTIKKDKSSHNMIEKKYRTNINSKILVLRDAVPSLRIASGNGDTSIADLEGLSPASKLNKASVLTKATEYIKHLERKNETLRNQNVQLQKLIQDASLQPLPQQQQQQQQGFGFAPQTSSFNTTPVQQSYSNNFVYNNHNANPNYPQNFNNNNTNNSNNNSYLLGGMAAVMGTSILSGDNGDFQGLSSLPFAHFLPHSFLHPSPLTIQLFNLIKVFLLIISIASLAYPYLEKIFNKSDKEKQNKKNVWISWILVNFGLQIPNIVDSNKTNEILSRLSGKIAFSWVDLLNDYIYLSSSETNFENAFLNLIIGTLLSKKFPILAKFLNVNMSLKGSLISNLDYKGDDISLQKLNQLIKNLDGISLLGSTSLIERLINLTTNNPINNDVNDGQNHLKYIEIYQENSNDYYSLIFNWRILEILHQLNLSVLKNLSGKKISSEQKTNLNNQIIKDLKSINSLINPNSKVGKYFELFDSIINPRESCLKLLQNTELEISSKLNTFKVLMDGQDLTDHEISDDDSTIATNQSNHESLSPIENISKQKSLIGSLNLINEEHYIVLTCSLILFYNSKDQAKALRLLKHLNFNNKKISLSLLSFTALLILINDSIHDQHDDSKVLDDLIKTTRLWINDDNKRFFLNDDLRGDISDLIVSKGMVLDGITNSEDDE
ncbi:hypothetical protein HYPBUDRAFT_147327 [Hyphopichia burtonii NRRL Y-1933]|uniref:BHLH domain-containing protein n=1 Tax=Hyphopichia burtonii NRRL Y-1933 TaxID=984485 RepID=A0A1E4RND1_9ASCO|nr:hypothetical protein HYPBUDRAFT_147327 [Hyphopichia burtonii NRRL Y-1933]ODV68788.1 hypothetical protein HYPBUDRAFT_147327 [Hyphopichia burtonii NRRL Y-1933]